MARADILVSAVVVLRDHGLVMSASVGEIVTILTEHYTNFEVVLIDNGSADDTEARVKSLLAQHRCLRYFRLTRPTDDETAIMAGLDAAIGDYVVCLHPDFDPPGEIPKMVDSCCTAGDLVLGVDQAAPRAGAVYRSLRSAFLALTRRMLRVELPRGTTGYRVLSRHAVNTLVRLRKRKRYFALIAADAGLIVVYHPYTRMSRSGHRATISLPKALRLGLSVLVHNSIAPLRFASLLGLCGSGLSFLYSLYTVVVFLFKRDVMPGWTTLGLLISGLLGLVFLILALMGEYLGRLLEETSDRPLYHTRPELSSAVMLADRERRNVIDKPDSGP